MTVSALPLPLTDDQIALDYGLKAQVRLLPYALGFFGIGLPIYIWSAALFLSPAMIVLNLILFAVVWTAFFLIKRGLNGPTLANGDIPTAHDLRVRTRRQWLCGGLWAISLLSLCMASLNGPEETYIFVLIGAGAAVGIIFFSAPVLLFLLTLAPLAMAGPIMALHLRGAHPDLANLVTAGLVLALAFGLILNRHLREHYHLEYSQLRLSHERESALQARDSLSHSQMALMETLSREVATGLKDLEQNLAQSLGLLTRAPAPRHFVERARAEAAHLLSLINTTIDDDGARSGQIDITATPLDIEPLTRSVVEGFRPLAQAKGLELTLSLPALPETGATSGDAARVEQILAHLLSNAIQYTPRGKVEVKLLPPGDGCLRIEVVDSGPGLAADELSRAFLPHERITRTSAGHSGAGLGLSLSRMLADLMGGQLDAQSTPDVGSKFWLDLPFDPAAVRPKPEAAPAIVEDATAGRRVLLLSNDSLRSAQLRDALEGMGHRCLTATTRPRALSLAHKGDIDAVLISTGMFEDLGDRANPDGVAAWLDRLRAAQHKPDLNIVALLPDGDQAESLAAMGVRPLLLPQSEEALRRALMVA